MAKSKQFKTRERADKEMQRWSAAYNERGWKLAVVQGAHGFGFKIAVYDARNSDAFKGWL